MINWNRLIRKTSHPRSLLAKIAAGYITVLLTVGCIIYIGIHEWREIKSIETNVRQINRQKRTIRNVYMKMLELSLFCDTFTEWDEKDFNTYLKQKSTVDSLLYGLQELHPNARIDSIRILWRDKEQSMLQIKEIMRKQQQAGREIAGQLPQTAGQSPPKKTGRKGGFLKRLFGKKEKTETSPDTSALHTLNRSIADRQRQYARQFSEQAHILASRNRLLNEQLQQVIRHMDRNIQEEMQLREEKLGRTGERSLAIVAGLVVFMLLLLGGSYMIIHRDMARINRYKKRLEETIGQLEHTVAENEELIAARKRIMLTVTHDLRTPLTTINSYAELLATEKKDIQTERIQPDDTPGGGTHGGHAEHFVGIFPAGERKGGSQSGSVQAAYRHRDAGSGFHAAGGGQEPLPEYGESKGQGGHRGQETDCPDRP